ncbi:hypothetical protein FB451DRAFT_1272708 [Mycena latifolia]|nr:hypothetical protein FB451DRAFT_1272708 [Mycena latifolia]
MHFTRLVQTVSVALLGLSSVAQARPHPPAIRDLDDLTLSPYFIQFFETLFFQPVNNATLVAETFNDNVAADAYIYVNGQTIVASDFLAAIQGYHTIKKGAVQTPITDPAVVPFDDAGMTGMVSQTVITKQTTIADGSVGDQVAIALLTAELVNGKRMITSWVEIQQDTPES